MAYDETLAERVRALLALRDGVGERRMFGSLAWMVHGNMACVVRGADVAVRLAPAEVERALAEPDTRPFEMGSGRTASGLVVVDGAAVADDESLAGWVDAGADYAASLPPKG